MKMYTLSYACVLLVLFPYPPVLCAKEDLVYKVRIHGCADSTVVCNVNCVTSLMIM